MDIQNYRGIKADTAKALNAAPQHKKLVLVSTGVAATLSLAASLLSFLLEGRIADTGGLGGLGLRSALSTVQVLLSLTTAALLPFWNRGFTSGALRLSRKEPADCGTLLDGFRRFGPVLRLLLLKEVLYLILIMSSLYLGFSILSYTPLAFPFYEAVSQTDLLSGGMPDDATVALLGKTLLPILLGSGVLCLAVLTPIVYRLRLAELRVMDEIPCGAIVAALESNKLMHRNCLALLRLDLSFWWFYLAEMLIALVCYGDVILPALGIPLPFSENLAYFAFYIIGLLAQLLLHWYFRGYVSVAYARFYDALQPSRAPDT